MSNSIVINQSSIKLIYDSHSWSKRAVNKELINDQIIRSIPKQISCSDSGSRETVFCCSVRSSVGHSLHFQFHILTSVLTSSYMNNYIFTVQYEKYIYTPYLQSFKLTLCARTMIRLGPNTGANYRPYSVCDGFLKRVTLGNYMP